MSHGLAGQLRAATQEIVATNQALSSGAPPWMTASRKRCASAARSSPR